MTIDEFIVRLKQTPRDWWVIPNFGVLEKGIRRGRCPIDYQCPLGAVACPGEEAVVSPKDYGRKLGLSEEDTKKIYCASDNWGIHDHDLRRQLLEACGLKHEDESPAQLASRGGCGDG